MTFSCGIYQAEVIEIPDQGLARILPEHFHKIIFTEIGGQGQFPRGERFRIMPVHVINDPFDGREVLVLLRVRGNDVIPYQHFIEEIIKQAF